MIEIIETLALMALMLAFLATGIWIGGILESNSNVDTNISLASKVAGIVLTIAGAIGLVILGMIIS